MEFDSEQLSYEVRDTESGQMWKSMQREGRKMSLENTEHSINPKDVDSLLAPKNDGGNRSPLKPSESATLLDESNSKSKQSKVLLNKAMAMDWEPTKTPETKHEGITSIEIKHADSRDESSSETTRRSKNAKRRKSGSQQTPVSSEFQVSSLQADIDSPSMLEKSSPLHGKNVMIEVTDGLKKPHIRGKKKKSRKRNKSGSENEVGSSLVLTKDDTLPENKKEADTEGQQLTPKGMSDEVKIHNAHSKKKKKNRRRNKSGSDQLPTSAGCQVSSVVETASSSLVLTKEDSLPDDEVKTDTEKELLISNKFSGDTKSLNVSDRKRKEPKRSSESDSQAASSDTSSGDHKENGLVDEKTEETSEKEKKASAPVEETRFKDNSWKMGDSEVTVRRRGGGTIIGSRPVFSDDAKYVYVNCGWGVRVFSIETGECVKVFDAFSKDHKVVACFCWKSCPAALTSEGVFIAWDPRSGRVQQKVRLNVRELIVDGFFFSVGSETILCLALETKRSTWLQVYSGTTFRSQPQHPLNHRKIGHPYNLHHLSVGCNPERPLIAFISKGNKKCKIINIENKAVGSGILPGPGKDWTCVQCHPTEDTVALGDSIGRIVVYRIGRAGDKNNMQLLPSVYHWHTLPVSEIAFTSAGSSMYSGGGELTLVKWNLENPHIKNYLPRLSADIVHIAVSPYNQMIAIATLDNGIQIVSPNNKLHCVLQQLSWSVFVGEKEGMFPAGLIYDPRSRGLMLNGRPGHLQLYSPLSETLTYNIDVTMMNYLTQERDKVIVNTQVTHSALTSDGLWLATIETRYEPGLALELKLKFWEYNNDKKRYVLATVIDMPHDGKVHSIKFSPGNTGSVSNEDVDGDHEVVLASTGADKKLRLWSKTPIDSIYQKGSTWRCQNACFYRDRSSGPCSFSYDGSLLAVGFNSVLTLWDVENVVLKQTITRGTEELKFVEFGRDDCCHILMCATGSNIVAWNLLTLSLVWKVDTRAALFVPDPYSCFFAIFTVENQWKILDAHNGEVAFTMNSDGKSEVGYHSSKSQVLAAVFAPRHRPNPDAPQWMKNSYLYYIDIYQELNCLEPANEISQLPIFQLAFDKDAGTPFGSLVGAKSVREATDEEHSKQVVGYGVLGSQAVTQLLRPPAHTLPSVSLLCGSFLQSFVIMKRDAPHAESDHEDKSEDDKTTVVASSDSEDDTRKSSTSKKSFSFKKPAKPKGASKSGKSPKARRRKQNKQQKTGSAEKKELDEPMETETIDLRKHFPPLDDDDAAESMFVIDD
uniref:WD repeat-containing protein 75 n=1 Tax=Lygus hesperus TaxID=30085 RepID=A0A0A9XS32_LYGHE